MDKERKMAFLINRLLKELGKILSLSRYQLRMLKRTANRTLSFRRRASRQYDRCIQSLETLQCSVLFIQCIASVLIHTYQH